MWQVLFLLLNCLISVSYASITRCESNSGIIYFTERACDSDDEESEVEIIENSLSDKDINKIERDLKKHRKSIHKRALAQQKKRNAAAKQLHKQQKQRLHLQAKCEKVNRQIAEVTQAYRTGYTIPQGVALDRKLSEYNEKRQKYCNYE